MAKYRQIQKEGLVPGKGTALNPAIYQIMLEAGIPLPDEKHFYAWCDVEKAKACARSTSRLARVEYAGEDRKPVVVEFEMNGLGRLFRVRPDPQSKPHGVKIWGSVPPEQISNVQVLDSV